jgi:hypothetical protein
MKKNKGHDNIAAIQPPVKSLLISSPYFDTDALMQHVREVVDRSPLLQPE